MHVPTELIPVVSRRDWEPGVVGSSPGSRLKHCLVVRAVKQDFRFWKGV